MRNGSYKKDIGTFDGWSELARFCVVTISGVSDDVGIYHDSPTEILSKLLQSNREAHRFLIYWNIT